MLVKTTFPYTGAAQSWTVPSLVTSILIECYGAPGGTSQFTAQSSGSSCTGLSGSTGSYAVSPNGDVSKAADGSDRPFVGYATGVLAVSAGTSYNIYVGGGGGIGVSTYYGSSGNPRSSATGYPCGGPGGYNGGAAGGSTSYSYTTYTGGNQSFQATGGGGGGGATDWRTSTTLASRIIVAGGGGGSSNLSRSGASNLSETTAANPTTPDPPYIPIVGTSNTPYYVTGGVAYGGPGGGTVAQAGGNGTIFSSGHIYASGGGTQSAGGAAGTSATSGSSSYPGYASAGALGLGGSGAGITTQPGANAGDGQYQLGAGGGGGYYGGGGGAGGAGGSPEVGGGGGGGSNYVSTSMTNPASYGHVYYPSANGISFVTYIQPPNAPTITSQGSGYIPAGQTVEVDWTFSSLVAGATQYGFDIRYQPTSGGSTWTTISNPGSTASKYVFGSSVFTAGTNYNIEVRTYDTNGDVSPWAEITVSCVTLPTTPVFTAPTVNQVETVGTVTFTWTIQSGQTQADYDLQVYNAANNALVYDSGIISGATASTTATLPNGSYTASVTYSTTANSALFSSAGTQPFSVNINPPPAAVVTSVSNSATGSVTLTITNPSGTYPAVYNNIYRTNLLTGIETQIGFNVPINTTFIDWTPATYVPYNYRVRAYSAAGGYADVN